MTKKEGFKNCDIKKYKNVDFVFDAGKDEFPFADNSVDEIIASHLLEHLVSDQLFHCLDECWRVLTPNGKMTVDVPKSGTDAWNGHPDHKTPFIESTFSFFQVPASGIDVHGYIKHFWHTGTTLVAPQIIQCIMYPNKEGNTKYGYFPITRSDGTILK